MPESFDLSRLATVQLVPPTPFTPDGREVVPERLASLVRSLAADGIRVFLPAAGTGEFHSLSAAEVVACVRTARAALPRECVVVAPVGLGVDHAVALGRQGADAGADALLLMPPVHPYLSDAGFFDYFQAIAGAAPLPLLAYKKGPVPSDRLLGELGAGGRLVGVKYAVNDVDAFARFADCNRDRLGLYCGTAERFAPFFMLAGASGYTSGAGNICPRLTLALHADLAAGRYTEAMRRLRVIRPIEDYRARDGDSYNITLIKYGVKVCGRDFGPVRPPQRQLTPREEEEMRDLLEPLLAAEAVERSRSACLGI
jgi:4-hydroxy-tetrahydrodipicolinate synthase